MIKLEVCNIYVQILYSLFTRILYTVPLWVPSCKDMSSVSGQENLVPKRTCSPTKDTTPAPSDTFMYWDT